MKIKYLITEIHHASVLLLKIYSKDNSCAIKVAMSFFYPSDKRLIKFENIPEDTDINAVAEKVVNNMVRGKLIEDKIKTIPTEKENVLILHFIKNFCKDEFVLDFIS